MAIVELGLRTVAVLGIVYIALKVSEWIRCNLMLRTLPGPDGSLLLGQLPVLARPDHHIVLAKWTAQFGGIYRMRLAHMNVSFRFKDTAACGGQTDCSLVLQTAIRRALSLKLRMAFPCTGCGGDGSKLDSRGPWKGDRDREEHRGRVFQVQRGERHCLDTV